MPIATSRSRKPSAASMPSPVDWIDARAKRRTQSRSIREEPSASLSPVCVCRNTLPETSTTQLLPAWCCRPRPSRSYARNHSRRARRLLQHRLPLCDAIEQELKRLANIAVRLVVGVQIVLELIHQPRELLHAIVDHDTRM